MKTLSYENLKDEYTHLWDTMVTRENWKRIINTSAERILSHKDRYQVVSDKTHVPWFWIGAIHQMESNCDFRTHLHNGDPLSARTRNVPRGRPLKGKPPFSWEESAVDALEQKSLDDIIDWPIQRLLYEAERFNGFGYRPRKIKSPYVWSGTEHYSSGKFTSDSKFSSSAVSQQVGVASILKRLSELDPTIKLHKDGEQGVTGISV